MKVVVTRDLAHFAKHTRAFVASRPIEHNVLATVLATHQPAANTGPPVSAWVQADRSGEVSGAAIRTPPRRLLTSTMSAEIADALMLKLLEADPELPGVNGPQPAACYLAEAWRRCTGGRVEPAIRQAVYCLERVSALRRRPPGRSRRPAQSERDLMVEWMRGFSREVGLPEVGIESSLDRRLSDGRLFVWDDGGVVAMVGTGPPVVGVVRLGPVYTPAGVRRRGYATALVADVSRDQLAGGATQCMLYADLANVTSNSIYKAVGYRRCSDAQEYHFRSDQPCT